MERRLFVAVASALIVAAVLYSAWITGQFTTPAVDRTDGYVSELAARDQPWTRLFRVSDVLSGLACLAAVATLPRVAREWAGWLALAAFGLLTVVSGLVPLDCAVLSDPTCRGEGVSHRLHMVAGALATTAVLTAMVVLSARWRSWVSWLFTGLNVGATGLMLAALAAGRLAGVAHRIQLTMVAVWVVYVALRLLVHDDDEAPCGPPHVLDQGAGPGVLITAGLGGAWFHWDAVAAGLAACHRVVRFDRPGLGLSPPATDRPTLYGEVARLAALAPAQPSQITLVAHGLSCWHAEAFARLHPLCVAKLVLVDPSPTPVRRPLALATALGAWLPALGGTWGANVLARLTGPPAHRLVTGIGDPFGVYRMGKVPAAVAGEWLARRDMAADLRDIRAGHPFPDIPVTVLGAGVRDARRQSLAACLDAKLVLLPGSGHQVELDDPDAIVDAV
ncbi:MULTISPECIES: alpha/beta fold hydrolase [unclassified Nonomuraea]|uniref:alpha/beta fold hydrolase n=1 Tax=unclassified Nonomuraea TaxID=2593643 RepID=UPI0033FE3B50